MQRKLTITLDDDIYRGLHERIGRGHISQFIEDLLRPYVVSDKELEAAYQEMVADVDREREALDWEVRAPSHVDHDRAAGQGAGIEGVTGKLRAMSQEKPAPRVIGGWRHGTF